jgi:hypothetical protein
MRRIGTHSWALVSPAIAWLALAGCLNTSGPDFSLLFRVDPFDLSAGPLPAAAAEADQEAILVTGGLETPCLARGGEIRASASQQDSDIRLQIRWEPGRACEPGVSAFVYEAVLANVRPGAYRLTVVHVLPGEADVVALDQPISVP